MAPVPTSELRLTLVARDMEFWNLMCQYTSKHTSISLFVERYVALHIFCKTFI